MPRQPWREVDDEVRFHLDMRIRDYLARGFTPAQAEQAARERFGDVERVRQALVVHDRRRERMSRLWQDARLALRGFRRSPTFTVSAVLILGIGMGMAVAMWTVCNAVLLRPLPVRDPDRIVLFRAIDHNGAEVSFFTERDIDQVRRTSRTILDGAGVVHWSTYPMAVIDGDRSVMLNQSWVTGNFFQVLGARPVLGRLLLPSDDSTSHVIVLSYDTWQRRFGGDRSIVGRSFRMPQLNAPITVVGVAPPGLDYPNGAESWAPQRWNSPENLIARLAPNASPAAARDEFFAAAQLIDRQNPDPMNIVRATTQTLREGIVGDVRPVLMVLASAVGLLLLIACINVGNLMLLRASRRVRELALRRALGATAGDIARQLLVESVVLAVAGGVLGLIVGDVGRRVLVAAAPAHLPRLDLVRASGLSVGAAALIALGAVLVFGLLPALAAARRHPASPLRLDDRSGGTTSRRTRVRQLLVASQVALALVMLAGAGLLARSLERLQGLDLGYQKDHLSFVSVIFPLAKYDSTAKLLGLCDALVHRLAALPGVIAVTPVMYKPFVGADMARSVWEAEGQSHAESDANPPFPMEVAGPDYFRVLGIPILRGRAFLESDRDSTPYVAIVSDPVARRLWPGQDPIGKRLRIRSTSDWATVVGVVPETHLRSMREATPMIYLDWRQSAWFGVIAMRSRVGLATLLPSIRHIVNGIDPVVTINESGTMDDYLAEPLAQPRMSALLLSTFGLVALALAAIGLFGLMASAVREQTRDIGVRMALGATPGRVRRDILRRAMVVSLAGAMVGMAGALATSRVLRSLLFEVSPMDPLALIGACGVLLVVAAIAAYVPASHASRVDPARALQGD